MNIIHTSEIREGNRDALMTNGQKDFCYIFFLIEFPNDKDKCRKIISFEFEFKLIDKMKITGNFRPVPLQTSKYFNVCWTKLEPDDLEYRHFAENPGFSYSEEEATIAGVFNLLECCGGTILNTVVIAAISRSKDLRNEYLAPSFLSIAIIDLIYSVYILPMWVILFFTRDMPPLPYDCKMSSYFGYSLWLCSMFNLLGIALLRWFAISYYTKTDSRIFKYACKLTPIIGWMISFLFMLPTLLGKYGHFALECRSFRCKTIDTDQDGNPIDFDPLLSYLIIVIGSGNVMLLLNVITFYNITRKAMTVEKKIKDNNLETMLNEITTNILEKEKDVGKMVAIVSSCLLTVYFPIFILISVDKNATITQKPAMVFVHILLNSIVVFYPMAFIVCHKKYRFEIKQMLIKFLRIKIK